MRFQSLMLPMEIAYHSARSISETLADYPDPDLQREAAGLVDRLAWLYDELAAIDGICSDGAV
jgi:hypothetical protein